MRIHHLDCISLCPLGGKLVDDRSSGQLRGRLVCHCLLVETDRGLVLVDTGLGLRDVEDPYGRLSSFFMVEVRPDLDAERTAARQIARLGFDPEDVRHIVLTHLDFDHAGGLDDFPQATVHLLAREKEEAFARRTWLDRQRFRPAQWSTSDHWRTYEPGAGERWYGFEHVRGLDGLPPDILLVPLTGHTLGHAGVAIPSRGGFLLHAGDAYFFHAEMDPDHPRCTPGLRLYQRMMDRDRTARLANQERLRELRRHHGGEVEIFCAHDPTEMERLAGAEARWPGRPAEEHFVRPGE